MSKCLCRFKDEECELHGGWWAGWLTMWLRIGYAVAYPVNFEPLARQ